MDKAVVREDVYRLLACPVPELRQAASELVAVLLLDAAEQHAKVKILLGHRDIGIGPCYVTGTGGTLGYRDRSPGDMKGDVVSGEGPYT